MAGAVIAFSSNSCPKSWAIYQPAQGRFIRGIDMAGKIDPDGVRLASSLQPDSVGNHIHTLPNNNIFSGGANNGPHSPWVGGNGVGKTGGIAEGDSKETRPKNVALLYCIKE